MGVLSELEPKSVFYYFEEIGKIPHGSGNVGQISDYLADFARKRNLFYIQDQWKNIIIVKDATPGYEGEPAIILQGHMDMVAVKKTDCSKDMKLEGLELCIDGDSIYAKGTSLGGDDGIAVAYALAILDSDSLKHPRLEIVLTVDEETGMDGAREIDLSMLKGSRMLNLDSEKEGIFLASCAGGARIKCRLPLKQTAMAGILCEVMVGGLKGGHSGDEIHKERGNSNALLGRLLYYLSGRLTFGMVSAEGGLFDNAIPRESKALLAVEEKDADALAELVGHIEKQIQEELAVKDPDVYIKMIIKTTKYGRNPEDADLKRCTQTLASDAMESRQAGVDVKRGTILCATAEDTTRAAAFLAALPNGVQAMSADMEGLVETSLNLGILKYHAKNAGQDGMDRRIAEVPEAFSVEFSVRSSVESAKEALLDKIKAVTLLAGGSYEVTGDYPGWKYRTDSPLREKMTALYEKMYGQPPKVEAIHAGLECGILGHKIKDLDGISLGPDMKNIHTTEETLSISSVKRVWEYLVRLLESKDE